MREGLGSADGPLPPTLAPSKTPQALQRADQIAHSSGKADGTYWYAPIVADAEAGVGGNLIAYELIIPTPHPNRRRAPRACTLRTSWRRPRSAATSAARCGFACGLRRVGAGLALGESGAAVRGLWIV